MDYSSLMAIGKAKLGMGGAPGMGGEKPPTGVAPQGRNPFATAMGMGVSGVGQGMMTGRFKQAYNAGSSGPQEMYYNQRAGQHFFPNEVARKIDGWKRKFSEHLSDPATEQLERGINPTPEAQ